MIKRSSYSYEKILIKKLQKDYRTSSQTKYNKIPKKMRKEIFRCMCLLLFYFNNNKVSVQKIYDLLNLLNSNI